MRQFLNLFGRSRLALVLVLPLIGCAQRVLPPPVAQTSPLAGRLSTGTIVAMREVDMSVGEAAVSSVLAALGQAPNLTAEPAVELVVRRPDNTVASIVQPRLSGQPSFVAGEAVTIVEAAATTVRPEQN